MRTPSRIGLLAMIIALAVCLGIIAAAYSGYIAELSRYRVKPLRLRPIYSWSGPIPTMKYVPVYSEVVNGDGPAIEVVLPSPEELGFRGELVSVQLFTKTPFRKVVIRGAVIDRTRGVARIRIDRGVFAEVLRTWLENRSLDSEAVEVPIEIDLWYRDLNGSIHYAFTTVHWNPQRVSALKQSQVLRVKPFKVLLHPNLIKPKHRVAAPNTSDTLGRGILCGYEWRYSYTWIDSSRDLDGWIPVVMVRNSDPQSATLGMSVYIAATGRLRSTGIAVTRIYTYQWDLGYSGRRVVRENIRIYPGQDYVLYIKGRATVNAYYEYWVCRDVRTGSVVSESRTGNVKLQTEVFYIEFDNSGKALTRDSYSTTNPATLLRGLTPVFTKRLSYGDTVELSYYLSEYMKKRCRGAGSLGIGAPIGIVALEKLESLGRAVPRAIARILGSMPILLPLDTDTGDTAVDTYLPIANLGTYNGTGSKECESIEVYAPATEFSYNEGACTSRIPILVVVSR